MSNLITDIVLQYWKTGRKTKTTPTGWISGNSVCCHHRGQNQDKRGRGGLILTVEGWNYSCFNCHFKAGWHSGHTLSPNTKNLLSWLGIPEADIHKIMFESIRAKNDIGSLARPPDLELVQKNLPENTKTFSEWALTGCKDDNFINAVSYVLDRKLSLDLYPWMWSSNESYCNRVIIPYYYERKIVGWTARKTSGIGSKYLTSSQPGYVFNLDNQLYQNKFVILTEAPFDAVGICGVASTTNDLNSSQISRINALGKEVIVVPDNDIPGTRLINIALEQQWSVSLPDWGDDVKDIGDAIKKFGRTYTLCSILNYRESSPIKITMLRKRIEQHATEK